MIITLRLDTTTPRPAATTAAAAHESLTHPLIMPLVAKLDSTSKTQLGDQLSTAAREGWTVPRTARELRKALHLDSRTATAIARTGLMIVTNS